MIINETITIIIAVIVAYLIGSIPFAYLLTRAATGKDIRKLGSGNGGAHNVYREVGLKIAVLVGIFDIAKGTIAVLVAYWLLEVPVFTIDLYVLLSALAVIVGHIWPVFLKFEGGNGLATTFGSFVLVGRWELLIAVGCLLILLVFTRNLILSANLGLLSIPISAWFVEKSWLLVGFSLVIAVVLVLHFLPTARKAVVKAGTKEELTRDLLRKDNN